MYGKEQQSRLHLLQVLLFIAHVVATAQQPASQQLLSMFCITVALSLFLLILLYILGGFRLSPRSWLFMWCEFRQRSDKIYATRKLMRRSSFPSTLFAIFVVYLRPCCAAASHQLLRNRRHRSLSYWGCCCAATPPKKFLARGLLNFESSNEGGGRAEAQ